MKKHVQDAAYVKDIAEVGFELVSEKKRLADKLNVSLSAVAIGNDIEKSAVQSFQYGLDELYLIDNPVFSNNIDDIFAKALVHIISRHKPEIFLAGATSSGRTLIPKVAAILKTGLTADCTGLDIDDEKKFYFRPDQPLVETFWLLLSPETPDLKWQL